MHSMHFGGEGNLSPNYCSKLEKENNIEKEMKPGLE